VQSTRDGYSDQLDMSRIEMAAEGYTPDATRGADGEGRLTPNEQAHADAEKYGAGRRAADEALVNSPGPWTPEKQAAAGRLRDFATINNPNADTAAVRYAGERLNDFYMSQFTGPLPIDPILGRDAASRARFRQEWQQKLEQGFNGMPPLSADAATQMLDYAEAKGGRSRFTKLSRLYSAKGCRRRVRNRSLKILREVCRGQRWPNMVRNCLAAAARAWKPFMTVHQTAATTSPMF
jgi:hypothetical protein